MKRTALKNRSKPRRTDEEREAMEAFGRVAEGNWCAVCGLDESYGLDVHHVISQQELKRRGFLSLLWDVRNALPLCAIGGYGNGCHERHENASRRVPLNALTPANLEFAREVLGDAADYYLKRFYVSPHPSTVVPG